MVATDFEYAGEYLKDWGYMICRTDAPGGFESVPSDSQLTFNNVKLFNGKLFELTTAQYEERIEISFHICKFSCRTQVIEEISPNESRAIKRWLNSPTFQKFKLIQPDWADIYMEGSFNVENVELDGKVYFLHLTFISNRPFSLHEPIIHTMHLTPGENYTFLDISDEIGFIYPDIEITCLQAGELQLTNSNENRTTIIENCQEGEVITFSPELLKTTSVPEHKIQDDFNYVFFRVSNSYETRKNIISSTLPVDIKLTYSPYVKVVS